MKNDIAVVIVNWNKKQDVIQLLSQLDGVPETVDIFVVDNASTDDSVEAIRSSFPEVKLIVNKQNLGGTGGFNTGLFHVSQHDQYSYVWLLDNDARIKNDSLSELLKVMNADMDIGLAGSRIVDIENEEITVEAGGKFRWDVMGVEPLNRNSTENPSDIFSVDYVAICSALVRIQALGKVGLMDDRLFLFWDDMDWGLHFNEWGFKVVCVSKSIVYHGSFTERARGNPTDYYYNIRNSLLVYTKHTGFFKRCTIFYRTLRRFCRNYIFYAFHTMHAEKSLMRKAAFDFLNNHWGKLKLNKGTEVDPTLSPTAEREILPDTSLNSILVSVLGSTLEESQNILKKIKSVYPHGRITILTNEDRKAYFRGHDHILVSPKLAQRLSYIWSKFFEIRGKKFDAAMAIHPHLYLYASGTIIYLSENGNMVSRHRSGMIKLCVLGLAMVAGEIIVHLLFPLLIYKSTQYKKKANRPAAPEPSS